MKKQRKPKVVKSAQPIMWMDDFMRLLIEKYVREVKRK